MKISEIPNNPKSSSNTITTDNKEYIQILIDGSQLDERGQFRVSNKLTDLDKYYDDKIKNLIVEKLNTKDKYIKDFQNTYNKLISDLEKSLLNKSPKLLTTIEGNYKNCYVRPSVKSWKNNNVSKTDAINYFFDELRLKGWDPKIKSIIDWDYDFEYECGDNFYDSDKGNGIIIECELEY